MFIWTKSTKVYVYARVNVPEDARASQTLKLPTCRGGDLSPRVSVCLGIE